MMPGQGGARQVWSCFTGRDYLSGSFPCFSLREGLMGRCSGARTAGGTVACNKHAEAHWRNALPLACGGCPPDRAFPEALPPTKPPAVAPIGGYRSEVRARPNDLKAEESSTDCKPNSRTLRAGQAGLDSRPPPVAPSFFFLQPAVRN